MLLRNDTELLRAAKALREEIEKIEDEINAIKRVNDSSRPDQQARQAPKRDRPGPRGKNKR
jgi:hypothetical protein